MAANLVACSQPAASRQTKQEPTAVSLERLQPAEWFSLLYDPALWRLADRTPETSLLIDWSRPVLAERTISGCYVGVNTPRDFGPGITLQRTEAIVSGRSWAVLDLFSDPGHERLPARVYADDLAVEYGAEREACLTAAVLVLQTYQPAHP